MNAPTSTQHLTAASVQALPLSAIMPSNTTVQGMRRARFSPEGLQELAASFRENDVLQPILVRPMGERLGEPGIQYEIVAGERRWRAAEIAGLSHIPAVIRDLSDEQALEAQVVENLQRDELLPLEEAEAYRELMRMKSIKAEDVGDLVGKSRSWVYGRLKLLDLPETARDALQAGKLDASRALLVARVTDPKRQEKALKMATERRWNGEDYQYSYRQLRDELEKAGATVNLMLAPFKRDDPHFWTFTPIAGKRGQADADPIPACIECVKRDGDVCTDVICYQSKVKQHSERVKKEAAASGRTVLTGEAAKKIAPRKDKLVGFVDLDTVCDYDEFQEKYPELAKDESDEAFAGRMQAYDEREAAHKARTYRALLDGANLPVTLIEDPKTRAIRELVPFKAAAEVLDNVHDIKLPSWIAKAESPRPSQVDYAAQRQKEEERIREQQERDAKELEGRRRVVMAIAEKPHGPLTRAELVDVADVLLEDWSVKEALKVIYTKLPEPGQLKDADLAKFIRMALVAEAVRHARQAPTGLYEMARRFKVDIAKVKTGKEEAAPKPAAKKAAPAKKGKAAKGKKK